MFELNDFVRLKNDDVAHGVKKTYIGTIVDILNDGEAYKVKFLDDKSETIVASLLENYYPDDLFLVQKNHLKFVIGGLTRYMENPSEFKTMDYDKTTKQELLRYLESFDYHSAGGYIDDLRTGEPIMAVTNVGYSDGVYTWSTQDIYHIRKYNAAVSDEFFQYFLERREIEKRLAQDKMDNPKKEIFCPRCGGRVLYVERGNSISIECENEGYSFGGLRGL